MYFLQDLHPADFYTSTFGFVFRLNYWITVPPTIDPTPARGEWQPLRESNVMLSNRFGVATRPYRLHMPKIMSLSLLREMAEMWPDAFQRTSLRPMRSVWLNGELGDIHTGFMFAHFVVERWREGLLWSWAVARVGGDDDEWDPDFAWRDIKGGEDGIIRVGGLQRDTLGDALQSLSRAGYDPPGSSHYYFGSLDGYPYYAMRWGTNDAPNLSAGQVCYVIREQCFPSSISTASGAFQYIAFERPDCGDCIINRLVQNSGLRGVSAALPPPARSLDVASTGPTPETLPLVPHWSEGSFSLRGVLHQSTTDSVDVRSWTLHMLNRYRYVLADSPYEFSSLTDEKSARAIVNGLLGDDRAFACLNDDVPGEYVGANAVAGIVHEWQDKKWPEAAEWEQRQ